MATLKSKTPKFKSIAGEMEPGGAPIYADDVLRVQENSSADSLNFYEASRRLLPELLTWDGATSSKQFENGLILAGCEYDNTDTSNPVVSEGFILSGGEVCYFPGGTYNTGFTPGLLFLFKGPLTGTNRVFNDGGSKEILIEYSTIIEQGEITGNGLELQAGTAITATDEVVVLQIGLDDPFKGEDYFTLRAALNLPEFGAQLTEPAFTSVPLNGTNTVGAALPYLVSRVNNDGTTEIHGSVDLKVANQVGTPILAIVPSGAYNVNSLGSIPLNSVADGNNYYPVLIASDGGIRVKEPLAGWPGIDVEIVISAKFYGNTTVPTPYSYKKDFLNIT